MKKTHIIGIVVIAVAIGAILSTVSDSSTYVTFYTASAGGNKAYTVVGTLNRQKPMAYNPQENANLFSFYLIDKKGVEKKILFHGTKPQDFEHSEQVVVVGQMEADHFVASKLLMKCPSKYSGRKEDMQEFNAGS